LLLTALKNLLSNRNEMADVFSKDKRSEVMSKIRGKGNKDTELALIKIFKEHHIVGWRRNQALFGRPDFVFRSERIAVFVDGCFWHGCPEHATVPKNNRLFWQKKLKNNKLRDELVTLELDKKRWTVVRIWEHELTESSRVALRIQTEIDKAMVDKPKRFFE
jgi:DNA mismatch endonuclease, patch repair protein